MQPAAEGYAIGDIDDPVRVELVQVMEYRFAHQSGMHRRDAIDAPAAQKSEMAHLDTAAVPLVNQRDGSETVDVEAARCGDAFEMAGIDEVDDLQMPRQHPFEEP